MKKLFYMLCLASPMLYASEAPVCTDEIAIDAFSSVNSVLKDLECKASETPFTDILKQRKLEFNNITQKALEHKISREHFVELLGELWFNIPRITKSETGETVAVDYPVFDSQGEIIYRPR